MVDLNLLIQFYQIPSNAPNINRYSRQATARHGTHNQFAEHTSLPTENFNEFVANVLRDNMGMIMFDL